MSRWTDTFNTHPYQAVWADLKTRLEISEVNHTISTDVQELARLKKVVAFLDNALENMDPELLPKSVLDAFNTQAVACRDQIHSFNTNLNVAHIINANNNVDNLLTYVRPYMIHNSAMKKTLLASVRAYNDEMEKNIEKFNELAKEKLTEIGISKKQIDVYEADCKHEFEIAEAAQIKIAEYEDKLFKSSEGYTSIQDNIHTIEKNVENSYEKIQEFYNETFKDDEDEEKVSIKTALKKVKDELEKDAEDTAKGLKAIKSEIENFDVFYDKIFGKLNKEDIRENGLKHELENRIKHLEEYEKTQQGKHTILFQKIESLLPGATSAGLATAYKEMKESFDDPINNWNWFFIGSIMLMFFATFLSFVHFEGGWHTFKFTFADSYGIEKTLDSLLYKLPLYIPLIWLAVFASKRRSEVQRLQQEYAHKEALAKSYDSYKKQIEELEKGDQEMLLRLIENSIKTIAHNASETLDKKHGDGTLLQETVKHVTDLHKIFAK